MLFPPAVSLKEKGSVSTGATLALRLNAVMSWTIFGLQQDKRESVWENTTTTYFWETAVIPLSIQPWTQNSCSG